MIFFKRFLLTILWMIFILILCLIPSNHLEKLRFHWMPEYFDKIVHFSFYFILIILMTSAFIKSNYVLKHALLISLIISIFYGISIELLQKYATSTRHYEFNDILANSVGSTVGLILYYFLKKFQKN